MMNKFNPNVILLGGIHFLFSCYVPRHPAVGSALTNKESVGVLGPNKRLVICLMWPFLLTPSAVKHLDLISQMFLQPADCLFFFIYLAFSYSSRGGFFRPHLFSRDVNSWISF